MSFLGPGLLIASWVLSKDVISWQPGSIQALFFSFPHPMVWLRKVSGEIPDRSSPSETSNCKDLILMEAQRGAGQSFCETGGMGGMSGLEGR